MFCFVLFCCCFVCDLCEKKQKIYVETAKGNFCFVRFEVDLHSVEDQDGSSGRLRMLAVLKRSSVVARYLQEAVLLAAPKKKVSYAKKRARMFGPHAMRKVSLLIQTVEKCPSCGHAKRANTVCMYCLGSVSHIWKQQLTKEKNDHGMDETDKRIVYPGKIDTEEVRQLKDKDKYLKKRLRTLPWK